MLALQSKLATMSNNFKQILEVRTENLKQQKNRREQFSQRSVNTAIPPNVNRAHQGNYLSYKNKHLQEIVDFYNKNYR